MNKKYTGIALIVLGAWVAHFLGFGIVGFVVMLFGAGMFLKNG